MAQPLPPRHRTLLGSSSPAELFICLFVFLSRKKGKQLSEKDKFDRLSGWAKEGWRAGQESISSVGRNGRTEKEIVSLSRRKMIKHEESTLTGLESCRDFPVLLVQCLHFREKK